MLRIAQTKNTLLDGATIAEQLYTTPKDCEDFFESIEKPTEVVAAPRSTCRSHNVLISFLTQFLYFSRQLYVLVFLLLCAVQLTWNMATPRY